MKITGIIRIRSIYPRQQGSPINPNIRSWEAEVREFLADVLELESRNRKYQKVNPNFDSEKIERIVKTKIPVLPNSLNGFIKMPINYTKGFMTSDDFANAYTDLFPIFYKRIQLSPDSHLFRKNYAPEVETIKDITLSCSDYLEKNISPMGFDRKIEHSLEKYARMLPDNRPFFFVN